MKRGASGFGRMAIGIALTVTAATAFAVDTDTVLIVVSGEGRDRGTTRPGYEFDEFSQAYLIFRDNGLAVDVASPLGGAVEADKFDPEEPSNARALEDAHAMRLLADTRATGDIRADDYAAVYVVGGKGAMFDLPRDPALRDLLATVYEAGGIVAAVCHGPAAMKEVRLRDGTPLVAGRAMTGFTNEEEALFGKRWAAEFPFLLETAMRELGADWSEAAPMLPHLVVDGRLITGQNPYSTAAVAEAVVAATGRVPVARRPSRDEASMALVQRLLAGEADAARDALARDVAGHHVELIGMLGYYQLMAAEGDRAVLDAVTVMEFAAPHFDEPRLQLAIAEGHVRLGDAVRARALLDNLLQAEPDMAEARALRERIDG